MEIRLSARARDMKSLPLDGLDMFLITRVEGSIDVQELIALVPADPSEVKRRVRRLLELGVIEAKGAVPAEYASPKRVIVEQNVSLDGAMTLKPPPVLAMDDDGDEEARVTARPPSGSHHKNIKLGTSRKGKAHEESVANVLARAAASVDVRSREGSGSRPVAKPAAETRESNADYEAPTNPRLSRLR